METSVMTGKVIRFDEVRGYGFVAPDVGSDDVFPHVNDLHFDKRLLLPGIRVRFVAEDGERGLKASQVRMIDQPESAPHRIVRTEEVSDDYLCDVMSSVELTPVRHRLRLDQADPW
jgi:cold shock protein